MAGSLFLHSREHMRVYFQSECRGAVAEAFVDHLMLERGVAPFGCRRGVGDPGEPVSRA